MQWGQGIQLLEVVRDDPLAKDVLGSIFDVSMLFFVVNIGIR